LRRQEKRASKAQKDEEKFFERVGKKARGEKIKRAFS
jgi:hypothetical protein